MDKNRTRSLIDGIAATVGGAIVLAILSQFQTVFDIQANWSVLLLLTILAIIVGYLIVRLVRFGTQLDAPRKRGLLFLCFSLVSVILLAIWNELLGPLVITPLVTGTLINGQDVYVLASSHRWITYDPMQFEPDQVQDLDLASIDKELGWIRQGGFDGIITFTSRANFSKIPELAKKHDLHVIMGIWDPKDENEISLAISKRNFVDGYTIGHNGLGPRYSFDELAATMRKVRFRTLRPVATTEKLGFYLRDKRILSIGDWVFPDAHASLRRETPEENPNFVADAVADAKQTMEQARQISSQEGVQGKPILLKMITYPMAGITNASKSEQAKYFVSILENRRDALSAFPAGVSLAVHGAFDTPWKTTGAFYDWDPYTGLFENTGEPRPAVSEIIERLP